MKNYIFLSLLITAFSCQSKNLNKTMGTFERLDPALDNIIAPGAEAEVIAEGFDWSEGPVWIEDQNMLLFSDVPTNTIYKWTEEKGKEVYLNPSGYTGNEKRGGEMGSNGLLLDPQGNLVLCQHGNRQMARMDAPLNKPEAKYITIADNYKGKKFSSPNDAVYNSAGELFFTDPPYGLETQSDTDPKKEIAFNGVYKVKPNGEVILLVDSITRPNGIAFLPGEKKIIIACSDHDNPYWYQFEVNGDSLTNGKIFYSTAGVDKSIEGSRDGLKVDKNGNIFATAPGGVWIFSNEGKILGKLNLPERTSNCALSTDEKTLFITNDMYVLRLKMRQ